MSPFTWPVTTVEDIPVPAHCTPRFTGIRCLTIQGGTPINEDEEIIDTADSPFTQYDIRGELEAYGLAGLDGMISVDPEDTDLFIYYVFDKYDEAGGYLDRVEALRCSLPRPMPPWMRIVQPVLVTSTDGFLDYVNACYASGWTGVVAKYKHTYQPGTAGRGDLWAIEYTHRKRKTREARVNSIASNRIMSNNYKPPSLVCMKCTDLASSKDFIITKGWADKEAKEIWKNRQLYLGYSLGYSVWEVDGKIDYITAEYIGWSKEDT
jgi:hypothetical protein